MLRKDYEAPSTIRLKKQGINLYHNIKEDEPESQNTE